MAIIGAGACGVTALKVLREAGNDVVCYEMGDTVGGNWVYENSNGVSPAYRSLHANTTRSAMAFSDLPIPPSAPVYPHHADIARYLNEYVDTFHLRSEIRFGRKVTRIEPIGSVWGVTVQGPSGVAENDQFDAVVVASGHLWEPQWPDPPYRGSFSGTQIHSREYRKPEPFSDKRVLIVGMGNSAMDIAVDISFVAQKTYISARHGTHILPKYLFGRPLSDLTSYFGFFPWQVRQAVLRLLLQLLRGPYARYGLQEPAVGIYQAHPTLSDAILTRIQHGEVIPKPGITALDVGNVTFADGSTAAIDAIIWCTGYRVTLPFLSPELLAAEGNRVELYKRVFPVRIPNLAFVGLVQQRGAIMPIAEQQARLIAAKLAGAYVLPDESSMISDIQAYDREISRRYLTTQRHTMEVEQADYIRMIRRELKRGMSRAQRKGALS